MGLLLLALLGVMGCRSKKTLPEGYKADIDSLYARGEDDEMIEKLDTYLEYAEVDSVFILNRRGFLHFAYDRIPAAIADWKWVTESPSASPQEKIKAYERLGYVYTDLLGDKAAGMQAYRQGVVLSTWGPKTFWGQLCQIGLGNVYVDMGNYNAGIRLYEEAIDSGDSTYMDVALSNKAAAHLVAREYLSCVRAYQRVAELRVLMDIENDALAKAYWILNSPDSACKYLGRAAAQGHAEAQKAYEERCLQL